MSARPRPVTATVTKPAWMQAPEADVAAYRRHSLTSNGSTASLTSVLDHDSYVSEPDSQDDVDEFSVPEKQQPLHSAGGDAKVKVENAPKQIRKVHRQVDAEHIIGNGGYNIKRSQSSDSGFSAWEEWLLEKVKDERRKRNAAIQKKKQEKQEKQEKERLQQMKLRKAEEVRQAWVQEKNKEERLSKKMQKLKIQNEKQLKEEQEEQIRIKAEKNFAEWLERKAQEEKERQQKARADKQKEAEMRRARQEQAEVKYQEWLKRNKLRPKSAPPQKVRGYYPNTAYPKPGYVNPIPWQHPAIPKVKQEKPKKTRPKRYVWNPAKYF